MKRFRIKIISGQYADRYVGLPFGGGLVTNPAIIRSCQHNFSGAGPTHG